jgi:hypothetical protein
VTVAFWVNYIQTQLNRHATDNRFITGQVAAFWKRRPQACIALSFRDYPISGQKFPANQFLARRTAVLLNPGQCVSLISLKRISANPQY